MPRVLNFYMDDSGSRCPDHEPLSFNPAKPNSFALGGVLIREEDEAEARARYGQFCERWEISYPLHAVEVRHAKKNFSWLAADPAERRRFTSELDRLLVNLPVVGLAAVIDRPGHCERYLQRYGRNQWQLCQTAFAIAVERATKFAISDRRRLRVMVERCSKADDDRIAEYYKSLRHNGMPFDAVTSNRYGPTRAADFQATLFELRMKKKSSPMTQIADLYLWPMIMGGYLPNHDQYEMLYGAGKFVDCGLDAAAIEERGVKYSCFGLVRAHRAALR